MHTCERNTARTYTLSLTTWQKITGIQNYTSKQEHAPVICKHLYDCTHSDITQPLVVFPIMNLLWAAFVAQANNPAR